MDRIAVIIKPWMIAISTNGIGIAPASPAAKDKLDISAFAFIFAYVIISFFDSNWLNNDVFCFIRLSFSSKVGLSFISLINESL